jgi:glutamyl/glutaminyl-tRNA synthetase
MKITHAIRGEEWISSTPKHLKLYEYFGWQPPQFGHLPLLLNPDKSKLSKRQGDVSVGDYQNKGYLPEALLNFVAFLGWNPGNDRELFTLPELIEHFSLEKVSKSGAVFNIEKLNWYNREYLKRLSAEEVAKRAMPWLRPLLKEMGATIGEAELAVFVALEKDRVTTLAELPEALRFCFKLPDYPAELLVWKKSTSAEARRIVEVLLEKCDQISPEDWQFETIKMNISSWIANENLMNGAVLSPLRVAVSGQQNSPGPFEIMAALGKDETLRRLKIAFAKF